MIIDSPALLNLCILLCDVVYHNVTEQPVFSRRKVANLDELLKSKDKLPFELTEESCDTCETEWRGSYINNASTYTNFFLYTRDSGDDYSVVNIEDTDSLFDGGFDLSKKTKIVVHGFLNNGSNYMAEVVRKAALEAADINVITVDWGAIADSLLYSRALEAVTPVGEYTGLFIDFLVSQVGQASEDIHLIGHSLGAHICGVAGQSVTSGNVSRITGLDPAAPGFTALTKGRLTADDATFVDVIHTCIGVAGWYDPCGTVDFYPNGGYPAQPGCGLDLADCPHDRSYYYYAESLSSLGFVSTKCSYYLEYELGLCDGNPQTVMGEFVDLSAYGVYYLKTNSETPFAKGNTTMTVER